eukprot:TRINITY_DN55624_c0_g1_i1.p1 TRINITY_DN55624_c0_g1~~TRINITY_DN55624_c0_g1_i1.p1  ORF type:complete len:1099 (-),score=195.51 TRINITY_DN55624_c0_g1_i1:82-3378(-)
MEVALGHLLSLVGHGAGNVANFLVSEHPWVNFGLDVFGSLVAVTGDAHQAKTAQDVFRHQVRYDRSVQIREDIRDVNKMMIESVQIHITMGSIILGVCFSMSIEGYPSDECARAVKAIWLLHALWSVTFTIIALWLALRFQMRTSAGARERLLLRHRYRVPDDLVVGRMGGHYVVNKVANMHNWIMSVMSGVTTFEGEKEQSEEDSDGPISPRQSPVPLRVEVSGVPQARADRAYHVDLGNGACDTVPVDAEPMRKGMNCWLHASGRGYSTHTTLDVPFFLFGETLVRMPWEVSADAKPLRLRVYDKATLYIAAQCPPVGAASSQARVGVVVAGLRKTIALDGQVLDWPCDLLPVATAGFHESWRGEISGVGEFQRVHGSSIYVSRTDLEIPLYKMVLDEPNQAGFVDLELTWNCKVGCEALIVVLRKGHVHCREEDWPLAEFNSEIRRIMPLRNYSGLFLRVGVVCLVVAAFCMLFARYEQRYLDGGDRPVWWFESVVAMVAFIPAIVAMITISVQSEFEDDFIGFSNNNVVAPKAVRRSVNSSNDDGTRIDLGIAANQPEELSELAPPAIQPPTVALACERMSGGVQQDGADTLVVTVDDSAAVARGSDKREPIDSASCVSAADPLPVSKNDQMMRRSSSRGQGGRVSTILQRLHSKWREGIEGSLHILGWVLQFLFVSSAIALLVFFCVTGTGRRLAPETLKASKEHPMSSDATAAGHLAASAASIIAADWQAWNVSWPPFFWPTAAAIEEASGVLFIASGRWLHAFAGFNVSERGSAWDGNGESYMSTLRAVGEPLLLPWDVCGLGIVGGQLVAVGNAGDHQQVFAASAADVARSAVATLSSAGAAESVRDTLVDAAGGVTALGVLGLASAQDQGHDRGSVAEGTHDAAPELVAAALWASAMPDQSRNNDTGAVDVLVAVTVTVGGGGMRLCRSSSSAIDGKLIQLSALESPDALSSLGTSAAHICDARACADEPVLWTAMHTASGGSGARPGVVAGVGLDTGQFLAVMDLPVLHEMKLATAEGADGSRRVTQNVDEGHGEAWRVTALTGSPARLVAVMVPPSGLLSRPMIFSTSQPLKAAASGPDATSSAGEL